MTEDMQAYAKEHNLAMDDPYLRDLYELDLSARRDQNARMQAARKEGLMEGLKEGQQKALFHNVEKMLADNAPIDIVYKYAPGTKAEIDETIAKIRSLQ